MDNECDTFSIPEAFISEVKHRLSLPHEVDFGSKHSVEYNFCFGSDRLPRNVASKACYQILETYFTKIGFC